MVSTGNLSHSNVKTQTAWRGGADNDDGPKMDFPRAAASCMDPWLGGSQQCGRPITSKPEGFAHARGQCRSLDAALPDIASRFPDLTWLSCKSQSATAHVPFAAVINLHTKTSDKLADGLESDAP